MLVVELLGQHLPVLWTSQTQHSAHIPTDAVLVCHVPVHPALSPEVLQRLRIHHRAQVLAALLARYHHQIAKQVFASGRFKSWSIKSIASLELYLLEERNKVVSTQLENN